MENCKNCGFTFEGNFCPNCGQKKNSGRIVLKESARDVLENYFDFDAPLLKTIKDLFIQPGELIRNYIRGKRKSYSHPFKYYISIFAVFLIVQQLLDFDPIKAVSDALGAQELPDPNATATKAGDFFRTHINSLLLIFALTLSLFSKLFNRKSGYNITEYLVLSFYVAAQYILLSTFAYLLTPLSPSFFFLNYLFVLVYPIYVLTRFHEGKLLRRIFKGFLVTLLAWLTYAASGFTISFFIVALLGL